MRCISSTRVSISVRVAGVAVVLVVVAVGSTPTDPQSPRRKLTWIILARFVGIALDTDRMCRPLEGANSTSEKDEGWMKDVNSVDEFGKQMGPFDVVLVDGRCRVGSALKSFCYMWENSTLIVHDWPKGYKDGILRYFDLKQVLQSLAVLSRTLAVQGTAPPTSTTWAIGSEAGNGHTILVTAGRIPLIRESTRQSWWPREHCNAVNDAHYMKLRQPDSMQEFNTSKPLDTVP